MCHVSGTFINNILLNCEMSMHYSQSTEGETEAQQDELLAQSHTYMYTCKSNKLRVARVGHKPF